ncbi:uncharacterized protein LOC124255380 isoform X2 [Haliotis rubra]|uniref:uncharacterized protein LOC124255380 isoform X2 n=1 Tax=Haliotis rubra TaxID=36100 RepID=UPI001EE51ED5|nr:uncharacterized protein LOC124255380 isoform X2 [Haliotis rubra]
MSPDAHDGCNSHLFARSTSQMTLNRIVLSAQLPAQTSLSACILRDIISTTTSPTSSTSLFISCDCHDNPINATASFISGEGPHTAVTRGERHTVSIYSSTYSDIFTHVSSSDVHNGSRRYFYL